MANTEGRSSNAHTDMKEESSDSLVPPSAANKCDPEDDRNDLVELQFLNAQIESSGKILTNAIKKKSFFQITSVTENVNDENDSMDELDESRADDMSSADLSKLSLQTDIEQSDADDPAHSVVGVCLNPNFAATNPNSEANGNGPSRFKLVKVARIEPIKRGRWTCKDFLTEPQPVAECSAPKAEQMKDNVSGSSSAASSVHFVPGENPPTDNPLGELSSASQQPAPPSSEKAKDAKRMSSNKRDLTRERSSSKSTLSKESLRKESSNLPSLKDSLNVDTDNQSESDDSTSATGGAIDNKIEQAMDLVKSHLLFAVREEVEVLKEQINELIDKNEQLQRENSLLRQSQTQGLTHLPYSQAETPQASRLVNTTASTQDQGGFPSMAGGAPRTDGFTQQQQQQQQQQPQAPPPTEQFAGMQAAGGPTHAQQAPSQQQALPQQQASQYGHIQQQSTLPQQTPHSIPQQTSTQHAQPPSQT